MQNGLFLYNQLLSTTFVKYTIPHRRRSLPT